jgi:hypothetical protein
VEVVLARFEDFLEDAQLEIVMLVEAALEELHYFMRLALQLTLIEVAGVGAQLALSPQ